MIYLYEGKIGDGKSYHVVRNEVLPAVRAGRRVYTNLDMGPEHFRNIALHVGIEPGMEKITVIKGVQEWRERMTLGAEDEEGKSLKFDKGSLIVIDEAQKIWDAREFKETPKEFLNLLEWHRHLGLDIVFITQNVKRLDSAARGLANEYLQVKNLKMLSAFFGSRYVIHHRQKPGEPIVSSTHGKLDPVYFRFYRSHHDGGMRTHQTLTGMNWGFYAVAGLAVFVAGARIYSKGIITPPAAVAAVNAAPKPADLKDALRTVDGKEIIARQIADVGCRFVPRQGFARVTFRGKTDEIRKSWVEKVCDAPPPVVAEGRDPFAAVKRKG